MRLLIIAIIRSAIFALHGPILVTSSFDKRQGKRRIRITSPGTVRTACQWFLSDKRESAFNFLDCCMFLRLSPRLLRERVRWIMGRRQKIIQDMQVRLVEDPARFARQHGIEREYEDKLSSSRHIRMDALKIKFQECSKDREYRVIAVNNTGDDLPSNTVAVVV